MNFIRRKICSNVLISILLTAFMFITFSEPVYAFQTQSNSRIEINSINKNMIVGERQSLNTIILSDDKVIGKASSNVTYESSDINVVKIENDKIIAISKGTACITANYENKKAITVIYVDEKKKSEEGLNQKELEVKLQWSRKKNELLLEWSKVEELLNFKVLKKSSNDSDYKEVEKEGKGNSFIDKNILPDCEYSYRVILYDIKNNSFKLNDFTIPKYVVEEKKDKVINDKKVNAKVQTPLKYVNEKIKVKTEIIQDKNNINSIKNNESAVSKENSSNKLIIVKNNEKVEEKEDAIIEEKYDNLYGVGEPIILEKGLLKEVNGKVTLKYYYSNKAKINESNLVLYSIDNTGVVVEVKDTYLDINKKTISFVLDKEGIYCIKEKEAKEKPSLKEQKIIEQSNNSKQKSKNELSKKSLEKTLKNNEEEQKKEKEDLKGQLDKEKLEKGIEGSSQKYNTNNIEEKKEKEIKLDNKEAKDNKEENSSNKKEIKTENESKKDNIENNKKSNLNKNEDIQKEKTKEHIGKKDKNSISTKNEIKDNKKTIEDIKTLKDEKSSEKVSRTDILNENASKETDEELSDKKESSIVKSRKKRSPDISLSGTRAYMATGTSVYSGPNTYYSVVGSVDNGEEVGAIATEWGWIYIEYRTNDGLKRGYVTASQLMNSNSVYEPLKEDFFTGYAGAVKQDTTVLSGPGDNYRQAGSIYSGEGVTVFSNGRSFNNGYAYIEFSTPSSTKRGYIETSLLTSKRRGILASVEKDTRTLAAPKVNAAKLGSVDFHELVVVLNRLNRPNGTWNYLEYNTKLGRKRGYAYANNFEQRVHNSPDTFDDSEVKIGQATKDMTVYSGPNSNYVKMGSINLKEKVRAFLNYSEDGYLHIEYGTKAGLKRGYVPTNDITIVGNNTLQTIETTIAEKHEYGKSGLGRELNYYKIGNGKKALIAVFGIHGFEDAWPNDGEELYNIAKDLIKDLENLEDLSGWTAYIIPTANPDGLIEGFTNDGPGRCNVKDEIDLNRSFPTRYISFEGQGSRNNNGKEQLTTKEGSSLCNLICKIAKTHTTVLLDIHGWENNTIGNNEISEYFDEQFENGANHNPSSGGAGYLISWGNESKIKSVLVELPWPNSPKDVKGFSKKVSTAIQNIFKSNPYGWQLVL